MSGRLNFMESDISDNEIDHVELDVDSSEEFNSKDYLNERTVANIPANGGGETSALMYIAPEKVGQIIGSKGIIIQEIQSRTGCQIYIKKDFPPGVPREITYIGTTEQISAARKLVDLVVEQGPVAIHMLNGPIITQEIDCPQPLVGLVIGEAGATIRKVEDKCGAKIQIVDFPDDLTRKIMITGNSGSVQLAAQLIVQIIENRFLPVESIGLPAYGAGGGDGPVGGDTAPGMIDSTSIAQSLGIGSTRQLPVAPESTPTATILEIQKSFVGRLIGRGGETIKLIQSKSGSTMEIKQNVPKDYPCKVIITGQPQSVALGVLFVQEIIANGLNRVHMMPPFSGGAADAGEYYGGGGGPLNECKIDANPSTLKIMNNSIESDHENNSDNNWSNIDMTNNDKEKDETPQKKKVSKWLTDFLEIPKSYKILEPPAFPPLSNSILEQFHASCPPSKVVRRRSISDDTSSSSDDSAMLLVVDEVSPTFYVPSNSSDNSRAIIRLYNLPYTISATEIKGIARSYGVELEDVTLDRDKHDKPSGTAVASLLLPVDGTEDDLMIQNLIQDEVDKIQEMDFKGRMVRIVSQDMVKKRRQSGGDSKRYFGGHGIPSQKCFGCNETGHRQQDCPNVSTVCHLCAGKDHEAMDCPNITCFRCGAFGHHSRSCPREGGGYRPKPILCTNCSDFAHDKRYCQSMLSQICDKINNSSDIVCMCCQQKGHVMCLHLGNFNPSTNVYCPQCGIKGHHCSYVRDFTADPCCNFPDRVFRNKQAANASHMQRHFPRHSPSPPSSRKNYDDNEHKSKGTSSKETVGKVTQPRHEGNRKGTVGGTGSHRVVSESDSDSDYVESNWRHNDVIMRQLEPRVVPERYGFGRGVASQTNQVNRGKQDINKRDKLTGNNGKKDSTVTSRNVSYTSEISRDNNILSRAVDVERDMNVPNAKRKSTANDHTGDHQRKGDAKRSKSKYGSMQFVSDDSDSDYLEKSRFSNGNGVKARHQEPREASRNNGFKNIGSNSSYQKNVSAVGSTNIASSTYSRGDLDGGGYNNNNKNNNSNNNSRSEKDDSNRNSQNVSNMKGNREQNFGRKVTLS